MKRKQIKQIGTLKHCQTVRLQKLKIHQPQSCYPRLPAPPLPFPADSEDRQQIQVWIQDSRMALRKYIQCVHTKRYK